ncbi:selenide, water dikinase SelD (plasmid) [Cytobacillus spongiae]|nr:selenide, water dikinase SelD [Cytobacillus spongiae]
MLRQLPPQPSTEALLVGNESSDDGGIFQLTEELAMVQTVDYFTPIVDDPYTFGQIAAANALSDVYAMGGTPKTVLNIVGFPIKKLGGHVLTSILSGAQSKVIEAGAVTVGGHSIDDQEPKFGLSVTGIVHPKKYWTNNGAKEGDVILITKPIGVGIMTTGIKRKVVSESQEKEVIDVMSTLNKKAAEVLQRFEPNAVTDITGFGLLGHSFEVAKGSDVTIHLTYSLIPILDGTRELAAQGVIPGGSKSNHKWLEENVHYDPELTMEDQWILCDAITSGGLLISLPEDQGKKYIEALHFHSISAQIIGRVTAKQDRSILVEK